MKFYKEADGDWIINGEIIPAGTCRQKTESATGRITIKLLGATASENILALKMLPTDFQDANGNYYADLAAYELATSDFFVDAALAAAEQLAVDLGVEVQNRTNGDANLQNQINAVASGYLGSIAYNASAPTPAKNGWYDFSTGGVVSWLTGTPTVKIGDRVSVLYTAPSSYVYTYQNINLGGVLVSKTDFDTYTDSQIEQTKEHPNYLLNSGEAGFPQAVFEVDANRVISVISTPSDAPFDINVLPTIIRFAYILPSNEKKIFLDIMQGAPKITLSFWTKTSQLAACGCTQIRVYGTVGAASAWRYITLPTTVGSVMKNNQDEEMRLEMTAKYGDWVCFRYQWDNTKFSSVFQFTFSVPIAGELYFANMSLFKSIIDIDPLTVRYKSRSSALPVLVSQFYPLLNSSKNFLFGNEFFSLCDSLGTGGIWQNKLAQLTSSTFDNAKNIDITKPLSIGGTATISNQKSCGQWRARNLVTNYPTAKTLFIMNINDVTITSGLITDQPFMLSRIDDYTDKGITDLTAANNYWTANFSTIVSGYTPIKGAVINIPYYGVGKNLKITGLPTSNGNISIIIAGKTYSIAVTTADTIQTLLIKILEYQYDLVLDAANSDGLSVDFYYSTGVTVAFNANGTGMAAVITDTTTAQVFTPRYFFGEANPTDWSNTAKWSSSTPTMNAAIRGLIEYLQKNMPLCEIIYIIPNRYGVSLSSYLRSDGTPDIDAFNASDIGYQTLCTKQKALCDLYNIRYVDLNKKSGITLYNLLTYYNENNVHPKTVGYEKWGEMIYKILVG